VDVFFGGGAQDIFTSCGRSASGRIALDGCTDVVCPSLTERPVNGGAEKNESLASVSCESEICHCIALCFAEC